MGHQKGEETLDQGGSCENRKEEDRRPNMDHMDPVLSINVVGERL